MGMNLDRGVTTRFHPSGMKVAVYDDTPGIYYTEAGEPLDPKFAREAGFDVDRDTLKRLKQERLAKFKAELEAELRTEEENLARIASNKGGYDVRHVGGGQYVVLDKDGKRMSRNNMTRADVELLVGPLPADPNDPAAPATPA